VETFYSWYDSWKDEKFVAHCGVKNSEAETLFTILIIALGIILVFVISSIIRYLNQKHKKQEELMVVDKAKNDKVTRDKNENIMKESLLS
jgi:type III secretory pathway component EscU